VANTTDWFKAVLQDANGIEIVYVSTHTSGSTTFSDVLRGQEGTTARAFAAGSVFGIRITAADISEALNPTDLAYTGTLTGGTGVINIGSGQIYKTAAGDVGIGDTPNNYSGFSNLAIGKTGTGAKNGCIDLHSDTGKLHEVYASGEQLYIVTGSSSCGLLFQLGSVPVYVAHGSDAISTLQFTPISKSTTATLTASELQQGIIQYTGTGHTLTLPTAANLESGITNPGMKADTAFEFSVINTGASGTCTIAVNTGITSVGTLTVAAGTSGRFRVRKTDTETFIIYRIA
jgi:hypothetical protein